jgi:fumarate hydratase class II
MVRRLSELAGFELQTCDNLFEAMQSMADMADFSAGLRTLAITLTRIANDFRLLASGPSTGLDELRLPPVQPGSSIMPGKVNPVMAEMLNMAMFHVMGCDTTVALAVQAGQLELNVMMPIIAHHLFQMMHITLGAVKAFDEKCVRGVTANPAKAAGWLAKNPVVATALNPLIGYAAAAELVKEALRQDLPIREVVAQRIQQGRLFHKDDPRRAVTLEEVDAILSSLHTLTEGGIRGAALR